MHKLYYIKKAQLYLPARGGVLQVARKLPWSMNIWAESKLLPMSWFELQYLHSKDMALLTKHSEVYGISSCATVQQMPFLNISWLWCSHSCCLSWKSIWLHEAPYEWWQESYQIYCQFTSYPLLKFLKRRPKCFVDIECFDGVLFVQKAGVLFINPRCLVFMGQSMSCCPINGLFKMPEIMYELIFVKKLTTRYLEIDQFMTHMLYFRRKGAQQKQENGKG